MSNTMYRTSLNPTNGPSPAQHSGDRRFIITATSRYSLVAIDAETGQVAWAVPSFGTTLECPLAFVIHGERVFASQGNNTVHALDYATGRVLWSTRVSGLGRAALLADGNALFAWIGGWLTRLSLDGARLWERSIEEQPSGFTAGLQMPGNAYSFSSALDKVN